MASVMLFDCVRYDTREIFNSHIASIPIDKQVNLVSFYCQLIVSIDLQRQLSYHCYWRFVEYIVKHRFKHFAAN